MSQNIYDNQTFFDGYSQLPRSQFGLAGAPEWADLAALLPPLAGLEVVDLGCGYGWFSRYAREQAAKQVLGIDLSEKMLQQARSMTQDSAICYQQQNLEKLQLVEQSCDLVFSSLTFHYIEDLTTLLQQIYAALRPGGWLVFSAEHPIYTAPNDAAWSYNAAGTLIWPLNQYQMEGVRETDWIVAGVKKQHRKLSTWINLLQSIGFRLHKLHEWGPSAAQLAAHAALAEEQQRPMLFLMALYKPN